MAAWSSRNVVLGSRVKLAVRPSEDVTLIFLEAGGEEEEEEEEVDVGRGAVVVGERKEEEERELVEDFCGPCSGV